ncbi:hypothetical protein [Acetobacter cibinongensis]|uniref:Uncharacterized protein n=1 Tax=Acetobacter cibinongensis TaxID=146475 RepID=A0A0D6N0T2_9PROT|nr:hypothetical protein [Acetobacter cibinongensis]GAN59544.1 hypothetical protein Abci_006_023 [Acetobacter cibinongensis]GBQ16045.1 hypothetical protein AA0482_1410 [Acetobacter cibinongensis NRIC 0482]GEL57433.1 hypothetical protein ACI01nite_00350 [Acetobacter cibinongensis]
MTAHNASQTKTDKEKQKELDEALKESFPASDPPSTQDPDKPKD